MKKIVLDQLPKGVPQELRQFMSDSPIYDSSSSLEAKVYFIDKGEGYYLKESAKGNLGKEAKMTAYFHSKGIGAEVLSYHSDKKDWLLTAAVSGEDCVHHIYLEDSKRLCDTLAIELRKLHEMDYEACPVTDRTADYLRHAESNYRLGKFNASFLPDTLRFSSSEEAYAILKDGKSALQSRVLLHGDYCLPNVILKQWNLSAFIDVGSGGVGDRHIDIFWGMWSLWFNLKTEKYQQRFLDAYGRDKVDMEIFRIIAAAEVFG